MRQLLFITVLITSLTSLGQNSDYFVVGKDTTFCKMLNYTITAQSYLKTITYVDENNERILIKNRKDIPDISTFYCNGETIDRIPQKANKPEKYIKWASRVVDGSLIVNYYRSDITSYTDGVQRTTSIIKFFVKMPDGTFYDINKGSDRKKHIIPYLESCSAFKSSFSGNYSKKYDNFISIIELYNSVCK